MSRQNILIFFADSLAAALVGAAVELAGHATQYAHRGEPARAALRRTHASAVIIDCDHDEACSDAFVGPALMTGARVILVRTPATRRDVSAIAEHDRVIVLHFPVDADRLVALLAADG